GWRGRGGGAGGRVREEGRVDEDDVDRGVETADRVQGRVVRGVERRQGVEQTEGEQYGGESVAGTALPDIDAGEEVERDGKSPDDRVRARRRQDRARRD